MRVPEVSWVTLSLRIATTTVHSRVSQLSQVIIKFLVAKIIIKVLFFACDTCDSHRSNEDTVDQKLTLSWSKSLVSPFLGLFHAISVVFYWAYLY
jgi:hypothetical protein